MATVVDMMTNFGVLELGPITFTIFKNSVQKITNLIQDQMRRGLRGDDRKFPKRYRRVRYARAKQQQNPLPGYGVPDLYLYGGFYRGMKTIMRSLDFETTSSDAKEAHLLGKYGAITFTISPTSIEKHNRESFLPDFANEIKRGTGLILQL